MLKGMKTNWEPADYLYYLFCSGKTRRHPSFRMFAAFVALSGLELAAFSWVFPLKTPFAFLPRPLLMIAVIAIGVVDVLLTTTLLYRMIPDCIPERSVSEDHEAIREFVGLAYFCRAILRFLLHLPFAAEALLAVASGIQWDHALMTGLLALLFLLCYGAFLTRLGSRIRSTIPPISSGQPHSTDIFG